MNFVQRFDYLSLNCCLGIAQHVSSLINFNCLLVLAAILLGRVGHPSSWFTLSSRVVCCSCADSKATDADQSPEHPMIDSYFPTLLLADDSHLVERAAPRLGRASPRLGRASPRLGRQAAALLLSRFNNAGRYHNGDDEAVNDYANEPDSWMHERRAAPRLGRAI